MRKFISIHVIINAESVHQFINIDKIIIIFEENSKIYIELDEYTTLETTETNLYILMDRVH